MKISSASSLVDDLRTCLGFYTRLPVSIAIKSSHSFANAQWAAPIAGAIIGVITGSILWLALNIGLPESLAIILSLAACMLLTGALHEDGLADVADGFGGGKDRARKLDIMRDSRLGTYGALALIISFAIKLAAISSLASHSASLAIYVLIAAHTASRALLPVFIAIVPPARNDGLSANVGTIVPYIVLVAVAIGAISLAPGGILFAGSSIIALSLLIMVFKNRAMHHIGGQTGDVLGALQQSAEIIIFVVAAASFL